MSNRILNVNEVIKLRTILVKEVINEPNFTPQEEVFIGHVEGVIENRVLSGKDFVSVFEDLIFSP